MTKGRLHPFWLTSTFFGFSTGWSIDTPYFKYLTLPRDTKGLQNLKVCHVTQAMHKFLDSTLMVNLITKFEVCTFSHSTDAVGCKNYKSRSRDVNYALWIHFCIFCFLHLTINLHTTFEVFNFTHSRDIEGIPKFQSRSHDLGHASTWPNFCIF